MTDADTAADVIARVEAAETHRPCCSSHGRDMTCAEYRRTHFVEVRPCCGIDAALHPEEVTRGGG